MFNPKLLLFNAILGICTIFSFCTRVNKHSFFEIPKASNYLEECILSGTTHDTLLYFYYSFDSLTYKYVKQKELQIGFQFNISDGNAYNINYCGSENLNLVDSLNSNVEATEIHLQNFKGKTSGKMLSCGFGILRDPDHGHRFLYLPQTGDLHKSTRFEHFKQLFSTEFKTANKNLDHVLIKTILVDESKVYIQEELINL